MGSTRSHTRSGILNPNFLTSLPYGPVPPRCCQCRHPPAPADCAAASGQKQKPSPPRSRLRNYPCILPEASAPLLFLGFSTFPSHSVTSVLRERHQVTHFTHRVYTKDPEIVQEAISRCSEENGVFKWITFDVVNSLGSSFFLFFFLAAAHKRNKKKNPAKGW